MLDKTKYQVYEMQCIIQCSRHYERFFNIVDILLHSLLLYP